LFLGYKPVQHVTVLNTVGSCNTVVLQCYNIMGPPSYMRSVVDRNVVMWRMTVVKKTVCTPAYNDIECSIFYISTFLQLRPSRPVLGPTQRPVQWVPGFSRG